MMISDDTVKEEYIDKAIKNSLEERDKRYTFPKAIKYLLRNKYIRF